MTRSAATDADADLYWEVSGHVRAEVKEKGSRFLAECFPVKTEEAARRIVADIQARHHDATHHCWALRLGQGDAGLFRSHDDGEPPGTAGAPILSAIDGRSLSDTLVVVTRWFGGVKLGTAGLARAYGAAAAAVLEAAGAHRRYRHARLRFRVAHADLAAAQRVVYGAEGSFVDEAYGAEATLTAAVRCSREARVRQALADATAGRVRFLEEAP